MHRENGGSEFRNRIARGLRSHHDGGHERIKRASGGDIPDVSAKKPADGGTMKRGGRIHHKSHKHHGHPDIREHHGWGDFVSGLGSFMKTALPIAAQVAPMFLKKGGKVKSHHRRHHDDGGSASSPEGGMRRGGRVHHREHHEGGGPLSGILSMFGLKDGGDVPRKAAGGVGKIRHGEARGKGYVD